MMKLITLSRLCFSFVTACAFVTFVNGQPAKYVPNLSESIVPPPSAPMSRSQIEEGLRSRDHALLIANFWIRDPYIVRGPDDYYYLTGTVGPNEQTRAKDTDSNPGVRLWRSKDLVDWQYQGKIFTPVLTDTTKKNQVWAPELHWLGDRWALVHCPGHNSHFALGPVGEKAPVGPWTEPMDVPTLGAKHDPSLFLGDDSLWMIWTIGLKNATVAPLNPAMTGWAGKPATIVPAGERYSKALEQTMTSMGHEGAGILKIGDKYVWYGTGWSTDLGRRGSYNLYYATSDKITGPYGPRRFIGRFLGHGNLFRTSDGQWWCTAFANANVPPISRENIQSRDLSDNAYTINPCGTTIVPIDVKILPDGDIHIRALDPDYATPGPDEAQQF